MQEQEDLIERPGHGPAGLAGLFAVAAVAGEDRLGELDVPVAERAPYEVIERIGRLVEAVGVESCGYVAPQPGQLVDDPAVDRRSARAGVERVVGPASTSSSSGSRG